VDVQTRAEVLAAVHAALVDPERPPLMLASANLDHLTYFGQGSGRESAFDQQAGLDWLVLLDGMPLVWMASLSARTRPELLTGSDLLPVLWAVLEERRARVAVLGGQSAMHTALRKQLRAEHPGITITVTLAPTRAELQDRQCRDDLADQVRRSGAEVLLVALGKPAQEDFLLEQGARTGVRVGAAFGAACDFYSGTERRVPPAWRGTGFEWLYRLGREPRRLGHRYLVEGPVALGHLLRSSGSWTGTTPGVGAGRQSPHR
jgi:exopolysaccharide biosynthesis WecB/TagA/CpsF family protein